MNKGSNQDSKLNAIGVFVTIAAFIGAIILWIGDARIDQGTRALSDKQIEQAVEIKNLKSENEDIKDIMKIMDSKLDKLMEVILQK